VERSSGRATRDVAGLGYRDVDHMGTASVAEGITLPATDKNTVEPTLAHRGYSGGGRLDIWVYLDREEALRAGAELVLEYGLADDPEAVRLFHAGEHEKLLSYYEQVHGDRHLFRVQRAWLQAPGGPDRRRRR
jgi:hypothetical protein